MSENKTISWNVFFRKSYLGLIGIDTYKCLKTFNFYGIIFKEGKYYPFQFEGKIDPSKKAKIEFSETGDECFVYKIIY